MDYKLRRYSIVASLGVIVLVSLVVLYMNKKPEKNLPPAYATTEDSGESGVEENESVSKDSNQIGNDLKGFLEDNYFFDVEENPYLEALKNKRYLISLKASSVQKDLRIQIVGYDENPVLGENFVVEIENLGQYEDEDKDGFIYVADLNEGDYNISLLPIGDYRVPENSTKIHVKEKVEYLAIEGIEYQIEERAENDEAEDVFVNSALSDRDKTEMTMLQPSSNTQVAGIDISERNGEIDWDKVADAGVEFAIVRVGYRGAENGALMQDASFERNMRAASMAGIDTGVYFESRAVNEVEAVEEASVVLHLIKDYMVEYPVYLALGSAGENGRNDGLSVQERTLICEAFCKTIESAGYEAGIFAGRDWFNTKLETHKLEPYHIWLAEYRKMPLYKGYYELWQHTSKGKIDGIDTAVNLNISFLTE